MFVFDDSYYHILLAIERITIEFYRSHKINFFFLLVDL